jgi:hypothetical protein
MKTLKDILNSTQSNKASEHSYVDIYDQIFSQFRNEPINLLEIGIGGHAGSIISWLEYFPNAHIFGLDAYCPPNPPIINKRFTLLQFNQADGEELNRVFKNEFLHIIIDDGSHHPEHQALSHYFLWSKLASNGFYFIEDIQLSKGPCNSLDYWRMNPYCRKIYEGYKDGKYDDILVILQKR